MLGSVEKESCKLTGGAFPGLIVLDVGHQGLNDTSVYTVGWALKSQLRPCQKGAKAGAVFWGLGLVKVTQASFKLAA